MALRYAGAVAVHCLCALGTPRPCSAQTQLHPRGPRPSPGRSLHNTSREPRRLLDEGGLVLGRAIERLPPALAPPDRSARHLDGRLAVLARLGRHLLAIVVAGAAEQLELVLHVARAVAPVGLRPRRALVAFVRLRDTVRPEQLERVVRETAAAKVDGASLDPRVQRRDRLVEAILEEEALDEHLFRLAEAVDPARRLRLLRRVDRRLEEVHARGGGQREPDGGGGEGGEEDATAGAAAGLEAEM
mmetsp:Transcript_1994/g.6756  ORF Transcript_1994/g.6756 Transcript_1994/m.6756 type:complete len:245 (-) Transcript_1994:82-816(-)